MKKKLKILSLALVFTLFIGALAGCGGVAVSSLYNNKNVKEEASKVKILNSAEKLSFEDEMVKSFESVLVFKSTNATQETFTFYSVPNKKVIHTEVQNIGKIQAVEFVSGIEEEFVFYVASSYEDAEGKMQYQITVRGSDGVLIKEFVSDDATKAYEAIPEFNLDLLKIGDDFYRKNKKDVYKLVATIPSSEKIPEFYAKNGDLYYHYDDKALTVFNSDLQIVYDYKFPSYVEVVALSILNNGKVLIQYSVEVLDTEKDYDYIDESKPYKLISKIIDVKKDKIKEVDLDYGVILSYSRDTIYATSTGLNFETLNKSIDNFAYVYEIEEERVNETLKIVSLNNKLKIVERFDQMFAGQTALPRILGVDRYEITNTYGQTYLLDGKGREVGDITSANFKNGKYIVMEDVIYDMNLAQVASCEDYEIVDTFKLHTSIIFKKTVAETVKYYLFTNGEFKHITDEGVSTILSANQNNIVLKNNENGKISVFNENLEQLFTTQAQVSLKLYCVDHGVVFSGYNAETSKYETYLVYTITKK